MTTRPERGGALFPQERLTKTPRFRPCLTQFWLQVDFFHPVACNSRLVRVLLLIPCHHHRLRRLSP